MQKSGKNSVDSGVAVDQVRRDVFELLFKEALHSWPSTGIAPLAHYTSMANAYQILKSKELWLSNPLLMNDSRELLFVVDLALDRARSHAELINALETPARQSAFFDKLLSNRTRLDRTDLFDIYVGCFSEFDVVNERDGLLSMWRGYAANGSGVAIIFALQKIFDQLSKSFTLRQVSYSSDRQVEIEIDAKCVEVAAYLRGRSLSNYDLESIAVGFFQFAKMKSLFTKHVGFKEEKEWRLVYTKERNTSQLPEHFFDYFIGPRGIEPKLKLDFSKYLEIVGSETSFENLVAGILLGPTASSPLAVKSAELMMRGVGMSNSPVERSGIPYRG